MRKHYFYIVFFTFFNCKAQKDNNLDFNHVNLIFEHSFVIDSDGEKSFIEMEKKINPENLNDSTDYNQTINKSVVDLIKETPKTKIHIEFKNDSIWRYTTEKEIIIGDIFTLTKKNGNLDYRPKFEKKKIYRTHDLFQKSDNYLVEKDRKKIKKILNYDCYFVKVTKIENDNNELSSGNTIYEMYVTENIKLPIHSVINITKNFNEFFPLEIKVWEEKLEGAYEFYTALKIK